MNTRDFYNKNAFDYYNKTIEATNLENLMYFESQIKKNGLIMDLGCGSGRDSLYFKSKGFNVLPVDYSEGLANISFEKNGLKILNKDFREMNFEINCYDGIWANASLLHLTKNEFIEIIPKLYNSLKDRGFLYFSLKPTNEDCKEEIKNGRFFTYYNSNEIKKILKKINIEVYDFWETDSVIENGQRWLNFLIWKK